MPKNDAEKIMEVLQGSIDFHVHSHMSPDYYWNLMEIGTQAASIGMRAIVVKNVYGSSHEQCNIANKLLGKDMFYGSLVLGKLTGGINPAVVSQFASFGGTNRVVEMPVFDSVQHMLLHGEPADSGIWVIKNSKPTPGVLEVLEIIARDKLVLKTGHISPQESIGLIRLAKEIGVKQVVVTHAAGAPVMASVEEQVKMASMGAVIEHCLAKFLPISVWKNTQRLMKLDSGSKLTDLKQLKESIREVGPNRCIIATDSGQVNQPLPHEQMKYFVCLLFEMGFSFEEIRTMAGDNPTRILDIIK